MHDDYQVSLLSVRLTSGLFWCLSAICLVELRDHQTIEHIFTTSHVNSLQIIYALNNQEHPKTISQIH